MPECKECGARTEYAFLADDGTLYAERRAIPEGTEGIIVCPKCIAFVSEPFAYSPENWDAALEATRRPRAPERAPITVRCDDCGEQIDVDRSVITSVRLEASTNWSGRAGTLTVHASRMQFRSEMSLRCPHCGYEGLYHITSPEVRHDLQQMWNQ